MIISASRRTDIPAFYSEWFMNRIRAGFFYRVNPFNSNQVSGFSLQPENVDAICFWSKNPKPLMQHLDELDARGFNYYLQFTLNPYDKMFEPEVPSIEERVATWSYNSCRFRCRYCYANFSEVLLASNWRRHFPDSPALLGRYEEKLEIRTSLTGKKKCVGSSGKRSA